MSAEADTLIFCRPSLWCTCLHSINTPHNDLDSEQKRDKYVGNCCYQRRYKLVWSMTANQKAYENLSFCHYLPDNVIIRRKINVTCLSQPTYLCILKFFFKKKACSARNKMRLDVYMTPFSTKNWKRFMFWLLIIYATTGPENANFCKQVLKKIPSLSLFKLKKKIHLWKQCHAHAYYMFYRCSTIRAGAKLFFTKWHLQYRV